MTVFKVSSKSDSTKLAGAIAGAINSGKLEIQVIGAGALNQAIKAVAIARGYLVPGGKNLICIPSFSDLKIDGEEKSAIKLIVEVR